MPSPVASGSPRQSASHDATAPRYRQLADLYRAAIDSGALRPGDRLPSMRAFMQRHGVSLSTATESYRALEREQLVEARPRAGYFVRARSRNILPRVAEPESEGTPAAASFVGIHAEISALIARLENAAQALNLGGATAAATLYPTEPLQKLSMRMLRHRPWLLTTAAPGPGDPAVRRVVARRAREAGMAIGPDDVVMTHGCIEGMNLALRAVTQPGDTVVVESPCFFGLLQVLEILGLRALEIPASPTTGLSPEALAFALQTDPSIKAVVVVPHLQNPLGCLMPDAHKASLVSLCRDRGVALIEDDPYRDLVDLVDRPARGGASGAHALPLRPLKAWDIDGSVIYCSSLNKSLAPGMRVGWVMGGRWHARIAMLKFAQSRNNDALPQAVMAAYLETSAPERHLRRLRERLRHERERLADAVARFFPEGTRFTPPCGGMFLWIELPAGLSASLLCDTALKAGIRIMPGSVFSNASRFDHFIRLSCPGVEADVADAAVKKLGEIASRLARGQAGQAAPDRVSPT